MKDIDADIEAHIDASHGFVQNDQKVTKDNIGKLIREVAKYWREYSK
jgi:hypothetical protein